MPPRSTTSFCSTMRSMTGWGDAGVGRSGLDVPWEQHLRGGYSRPRRVTHGPSVLDLVRSLTSVVVIALFILTFIVFFIFCLLIYELAR